MTDQPFQAMNAALTRANESMRVAAEAFAARWAAEVLPPLQRAIADMAAALVQIWPKDGDGNFVMPDEGHE